MSTRALVLLGAFCLSLVVAPSVLARSNVVFQKSAKKSSTLVVTHALTPGHRYRLDVLAQGRHPVMAQGFEFISGVFNGKAFTETKPFSFSATTPVSKTVIQPVSGRLGEWTLSESILLRGGRGLTVRLIDLGKRT